MNIDIAKLELRQEGARLEAIFKNLIDSSDKKFAFYLYRNGERIATRWYSESSNASFIGPHQPGRYTVTGFCRTTDNTITRRLRSVAVVVPSLKLPSNDLPAVEVAPTVSAIAGLLRPAKIQRIDVQVNELTYSLLTGPGNVGKQLFVMLRGAEPDRRNVELPRFSRFSWRNDFPGSVVCIADPTLQLDPQLRLGWYFGSSGHDVIAGVCSIVEALCSILKIAMEDVVFYGSSGGGYAALQSAARSGQGATAVAINPQTDILDYGVARSVDAFSVCCLGGMTRENARDSFRSRLSAVLAWQQVADARCLLVQNIKDLHHYTNHYRPFADAYGVTDNGLSADGRMASLIYSHPSGHGAEPRAMVPEIIQTALALRWRSINKVAEKFTIAEIQNKRPLANNTGVSSHSAVLTLSAGGCLMARIEFEAPAGSSYAFYLYRERQRVAVRSYMATPVAVFEGVDKLGHYYVRVFIQLPDSTRLPPYQSNDIVISSPKLDITVPNMHVALRRTPIKPLAPVSTSATGVISSQQIYLTSNKCTVGERPGTILYRPRGDVTAFEIDFPLDWSIDPFKDRNWNAQLHMWRLGDFLLLEAARADQTKSLKAFLPIMLDWHRHHVKEKRKSIYAWQDMMVGIRAMKLAFVISQWQHGHIALEEQTKAVLRELVEVHLGFLLDPSEVRYSNHTLSDLHGAMALAQVVDNDTRESIESFVEEFFPKVLNAQFDSNCVHRENSLGYHCYGIKYFKGLLKSGWFDRFGLADIVDQAEIVAQWFLLPDGRTAPIGDTDGSVAPTHIEKPVFTSSDEVFARAGYVIVRDDGGGELDRSSYLFFMGGYNSKFHKQADDMSVLWYQGEDILCDAGKYAYKTDAYRNYVISRRAHNTVEIDTQRDGELSGAPYGSAVDQVDRYDWGHMVRGHVHFSSLGVTHYRTCLYAVGRWLLIIDTLDALQPHRYVQWSHFSPGLSVRGTNADGFDASLPSSRTLAVRTVADGTTDMEFVTGKPPPRPQGWISRGYRKIEPALAFGVRRDSNKALFATLFAINDPACSLKCAIDRKLTLCISQNGTRRQLEFLILPEGRINVL